MSRLPLLATALLVLLGGALLATAWWRSRPPVAAPSTALRPVFSLLESGGRPISEQELRGRPALVYFGYTFCPDVCPTELGYTARLLDALGDDAGRLTALFISVDPERDSLAQLAAYAPLFHPRLRAATGSATAVAVAAAAFSAFYQKVIPVGQEGPGGHYLLDHTSVIYLLDREGRIAAKLDSRSVPLERAVALVRGLL